MIFTPLEMLPHEKLGVFKGRFSEFSGETFRVLKEKEENQYGEYRTKRFGSPIFT